MSGPRMEDKTTSTFGNRILNYDTPSQSIIPRQYDIVARHHLIESEGHNLSKLGSLCDVGGAFHVYKRGESHNRVSALSYRSPGGEAYEGEFVARANVVSPTSSLWPSCSIASNTMLDARGTTAIARTIPTNPNADLATFLGELREGLPSLPGSSALRGRANVARSAGREYLNAEFGWKPLVRDLQDICGAIMKSDEIMRNFAENSGKPIRRRYHFPTEESTVSEEQAPTRPSPTLHSSLAGAAGKTTKLVHTRERVWFSGAFTYLAVPEDGNRFARYAQQAKHLVGARLDAEVLWNLAPWSWMADWYANVGDVIHNASAFSSDSLVLLYGYIMREQEISHTWTVRGATVRFGGGYKDLGPLNQTFIARRQQRRRATPYGFGLNDGDFSNRQKAIIAALGLSRA